MTMVRNDDFFLNKWVDYYGSQLGKENLYIYLDGEDQPETAFLNGCNLIKCKHIDESIRKGDRRRANFLSEEAKRLLPHYDAAIGVDVDEFLVVDPKLGLSLIEFIKKYKNKGIISALGIDIGQVLSKEDGLDPQKKFLTQRHYGRVYSRYTKTSIITLPQKWGSGFHRVKGKNFFIAPDLYLFHFGGADIERLKAKSGNNELQHNGWERHLRKRESTILRITSAIDRNNVKDWDKIIPLMRRCEQVCRPIFAWNKPTSFGITPVVKIPERFQNSI